MTRADPLVTHLNEKFIVDEIALSQSHLAGKCFNIFHEQSAVKFDLFPALSEFHRQQLERAISVKPASSPRAFWIASLEDILIAKLDWFSRSHSERQEQDIMALLSVNRHNIDTTYLEDWAEKLGVIALLREIRAKSLR